MTWTATVLVSISPPTLIWKARAHVLWTSKNRYYGTPRKVSASTAITCITSAAKIWIFALNDTAEEHEWIQILSGQVFRPIAFMLNGTTTKSFWLSKCFRFFNERKPNSGSVLFCLRCLREWGWSGAARIRDQGTSLPGGGGSFQDPDAKLLQLPPAYSYTWLKKNTQTNTLLSPQRDTREANITERRDINWCCIENGY